MVFLYTEREKYDIMSAEEKQRFFEAMPVIVIRLYIFLLALEEMT
jgi:hypothetical protein